MARGTAAYRRTSLAMGLASFSPPSLRDAVQPLLPNFTSECGIAASEASLAPSLTIGFLASQFSVPGPASETLDRRGLMFASMVGGALLHMAGALVPGWYAILARRAAEG